MDFPRDLPHVQIRAVHPEQIIETGERLTGLFQGNERIFKRRLRRLTRYRYNNVPLDLGGRYLYLRDDASGEYWSPSWQPR